MIIKIIEYREKTNDCLGIIDGHVFVIDPFVGCAILQEDENYIEVGKSIVGNSYEMPDDVLVADGVFLPSEKDFVLIKP